jgi:hypothetical protein
MLNASRRAAARAANAANSMLGQETAPEENENDILIFQKSHKETATSKSEQKNNDTTMPVTPLLVLIGEDAYYELIYKVRTQLPVYKYSQPS